MLIHQRSLVQRLSCTSSKICNNLYAGATVQTSVRAMHYIPRRNINSLNDPYTELRQDNLEPAVLYKQLNELGFDFYTGIPDSILKNFLEYLEDQHPSNKNIISANEGTALGIASGYHLATGKIPIVYMQNAGVGNMVNPLLSLVDRRVYKIPILFLMGWRGEPGRKDEPQYMAQGQVMPGLLTDLDVTHQVLPDFEDGTLEALDQASYHLKTRQTPYAFLIRNGMFSPYQRSKPTIEFFSLPREDAMHFVIENIGKFDVVLSSSGNMSRELFIIRDQLGMPVDQDFYCLGARGHVPSIAQGVAIGKPDKTVYCLDGDGSLLIHMGNLAQIGTRSYPKFKHILFNNAAHETVGGSPTVGNIVNFVEIAKACSYKYAKSVTTMQELETYFYEFKEVEGPAFLELKVSKRPIGLNLPPLRKSPQEIKNNFMSFLDR